MKFNGLRESRVINFDDLQKNVVEFSVLEKINFDDLQEKRRLMNFSDFKKIGFNGLKKKNFSGFQEKKAVR